MSTCPGPLTNGENHLCAIETPGQLQNWTFTAAQGDYVALSASQVDGTVQPSIRLISPTGAEVVSASACCGIVNQSNVTISAAGTYTVVISSQNAGGGTTGTGNYLLRLAQVPVFADDAEVEVRLRVRVFGRRFFHTFFELGKDIGKLGVRGRRNLRADRR